MKKVSRDCALRPIIFGVLGCLSVNVMGEIEEITVTGSHIKHSPTDAASPVSVMEMEELSRAPNIATMIQDLSVSSGTENQSNQFSSGATTGTANINLRGLGLNKTLVLFNGKRQVTAAISANDGSAFVDIGNFPKIALQRVEILKDGAAAIYGSDAVAGVANFITRKNFSGFEIQGEFSQIADSSGDYEFGAIWGAEMENTNLMVATNVFHRSELGTSDRGFTQPQVDIPEIGATLYGQSSVGNPGSFLPIGSDGAPSSTSLIRDPQCAEVGGILTSQNRCGFQFIEFSNLAEKEDRLHLFSEITHDFSSGLQAYGELLYSELDVPDWKTSPSYPPVLNIDPARYLPPNHPGLQDAIDNLGIADLDSDGTNEVDFSGGAIFVGRPIGVTGPSSEGSRKHTTHRIVGGLKGELSNATEWDLSLQYSASEARIAGSDTVISRYSAALQGFGGPNCNGSTPGENGCEYYNPFSNAINSNDVALMNSPALLEWLTGVPIVNTNSTELTVLDGVVTGDFHEQLSYAAGAQYRSEALEVRYNDLADLELNPGISTGNDVPGIFTFARGGTEGNVNQDIVAVYGELAYQPVDNIDLQMALRYEDWGTKVGSSIDPKIAIRWDISDQFTLRSSASTTFRGPSLNQTKLSNTALEFIGQEFAFKAVDRIGNEDIDPESAVTFNLGMIFTPTELAVISLDYWRFDFKDPIIRQASNDIVGLCPTSSSVGEFCDQITFGNDGSIARIQTHYVNGPDILTDGLDLSAKVGLPIGYLEWVAGINASYINQYEVDTFMGRDAFDAVGRLNASTFLRPLPKKKGALFAGFDSERHHGRITFRYVDSYVDDGLNLLLNSPLRSFVTETNVDSHVTLDLHYGYRFRQEQAGVNLSVTNLTNEEPPVVRSDLRYDARTHNPLGRIIRLSFNYEF